MAKRKCRYGKLKKPIGKRVCRKRPTKGHKKVRRATVHRRGSKSHKCVHGKLKNPRGRRVCKKR